MRIAGFEWNDRNLEHISRHGVTPEEVEETCYYQPFILKSKYNRYLILGQSQGGRYLAIVIEQKKMGIVRVLIARDMNNSERRKYIKER